MLKSVFNLNTKILVAGNILVIVMVFLYYVELLKLDIVFKPYKIPMFWISTGLLIFNAGELPYNLFFDYILKNRQDFKAILFTAINEKLVYILYSFISIGLLCTKMLVKRGYHTK
jgi:hypothetical protein